MLAAARNAIAGHKRDAMLIGVPKEIKVHEYRVGLTPSSVRELVAAGHGVVVETRCRRGHRRERS